MDVTENHNDQFKLHIFVSYDSWFFFVLVIFRRKELDDVKTM